MSQIKLEIGSTPATPATGFVTVYPKSDKKLYIKDEDGIETDLTSGGSVLNAEDIPFTPAGDIVATDLQAAVEELDTEKAPITHVGAKGVSQHAVADGTDAGFMSPSDKTKLDGIASGATANDTDSNLKNRANHTGTQLAGTISDFSTAADDRVTIGIAAHVAESDPHPNYATETALAAGITTAQARSGHTGTQTASTISDFDSAARTATVDNAITNGVTTKAPSQDAVFDALNDKVDKTGDTMDGPLDMVGDLLGTGHIILRPQDNPPSTPTSGVALYTNTDEQVTWRSQSDLSTSFDCSLQSDNRVYTLPDIDGPILVDPTSVPGDMIYRNSSDILDRVPVGAEDEILRIVGGIPQWVEENLSQDIGGGGSGNVTLSGAFTAPDIMYYDELVIDAGTVFNPDAYIIYAKKLDLTNAPAGAITRSGNPGTNGITSSTGQAGGTGFTVRVLGTNSNGGNGAAGQTNAGTQGGAAGAVTVGNGGIGGASGASGAGGSGIGANAIAGGAVSTNIHFGRFEYQFLRGATSVSGGAGGRGGNSGGGNGASSSRGAGGGGAGGAVLVLIVGELITGPSTPAGVIVAKGGKGGSQANAPATGDIGGASGAGGGGGGYIYLAYVKKTGSTVADLLDASGGDGGDGGPGLGTGIGGAGGAGGAGGRIQLFNVTEGIGTLTVGSAGSNGSAASGITGGIGGTGGVCKVSI